MRYPCLVLDHDDTVVNSTATVHHPCFQVYLDQFYPGAQLSLEEYFTESFDGSFLDLCRRRYQMTDAQLQHEQEFWNRYVADHIPQAYPGMRELLHRYKDAGGLICVVSHSLTWNIRRDYEANGLPQPDLIFGWDLPPHQRKPAPYPLQAIMQTYKLQPEQLLMVDDLKPGYDMAKQCNVAFAAAGWANEIPVIQDFMRQHCDHYLHSVSDLEQLIF